MSTKKKLWFHQLKSRFFFLVLIVMVYNILVIPPFIGLVKDNFGMLNNKPLEKLASAPGGREDVFQSRLLTALLKPGNNNPAVSAEISALIRLRKSSPEILKRYLATSPYWRVFMEHNSIYATRRWMIGSHWRYALNGYFTRSDIDPSLNSKSPYFQTRLTLGFSQQTWSNSSVDFSLLHPGETASLKLKSENHLWQSDCMIIGSRLSVEIFEQSDAAERRLTKATLEYLQNELQPLAVTPNWSTIRAILPKNAIRKGKQSIRLYNST